MYQGEAAHNIVMWMDHRAEKEAGRINSTGHSVLRYVGGAMSLEMQPPKLLWLKEVQEPLPHCVCTALHDLCVSVCTCVCVCMSVCVCVYACVCMSV